MDISLPGRLPDFGKEPVARGDCVHEQDLSREHIDPIGDYLLEFASEFHEDFPVRLCTALNLRDGGKQDIYVSDPCGRLDSVCRVSPGAGARAVSLETVPQIILSENYRELKRFDFHRGEGFVSIAINGETFDIEVQKGVRKPGQIPLLTLQIMAMQVNRIFQNAKRPVAVWDLGCGSGFLGLVAKALLEDKIAELKCSDISQPAINCTRANIARLELSNLRLRVEQANLFDSTPPDESYDLIVFNPPFLPDGLAGQDGVDGGGPTGIETVLKFCSKVSTFIRPGGSAITVVPGYVDDGRVSLEMVLNFGSEHVARDERWILYPEILPPDIPKVVEVRLCQDLQILTGNRLEICRIGKHRFVAFTLRHYIATKV